ncbi:MAG: hypothetical protein C4293_06675 [Nitrospiraceae bacterium]
MESSTSRNAMIGLKIAGAIILAIIVWKVLAFLSGIIWLVLKFAIIAAIAIGVIALVSRSLGGRSLPGGRRSLP